MSVRSAAAQTQPGFGLQRPARIPVAHSFAEGAPVPVSVLTGALLKSLVAPY